MFGIEREWVKELIVDYRKQNPTDTREDRIIKEAILEMRDPSVYNQYLKQWMYRQIFENNDTIEDIIDRKHKRSY